jgi:hypothetical protein
MDTKIGLRKILSFIGLIFIIGAAYMNLLGIMEANTTNNKDTLLGYIISANLINSLAVLCLVVLTINSTKLSSLFKLLLILVLLAGLIGELYLVSTDLYSKNYVNYVLLIVNLLIRVYYLVFYFNDSWAMFPGASQVNDGLFKATVPLKEAEPTDSEIEAFKDRWRNIFKQGRQKVGKDNFDDASMSRAWDEIINPAIQARDFSTQRLKDAADYLKDTSGNKITDLVIFGGRKKR